MLDLSRNNILNFLAFASIPVLLIILNSPVNNQAFFYTPVLVGLYAVFNGCKAVFYKRAKVLKKTGFFNPSYERVEFTGNYARTVGVLWVLTGSLFVLLGLRLFKIL